MQSQMNAHNTKSPPLYIHMYIYKYPGMFLIIIKINKTIPLFQPVTSAEDLMAPQTESALR